MECFDCACNDFLTTSVNCKAIDYCHSDSNKCCLALTLNATQVNTHRVVILLSQESQQCIKIFITCFPHFGLLATNYTSPRSVLFTHITDYH